jgi:hypothetical protein
MPGGLQGMFNNLPDRSTNDDQIGLGDPFGKIDRGMGDSPDPPGDSQANLPAADADHVIDQVPLAQRQADRSPDQPHADNRHVCKSLHQSVPPLAACGNSEAPL